MQFTLGIGIMIAGGLLALLGALLLFNHNGVAKIVLGILLAVTGVGGLVVGYSLDQFSETEYTVSDIQELTARDTNQYYRVTLKYDGGETWVYADSDQIFRFEKDSTIVLKKSELKRLRDESNRTS
ncbi:MAG: hypothetical protein IJ055_10100 [Oscillospiraceae bacterium]|nr:hypothetical protein [Oscillospiraceae bacterium]